MTLALEILDYLAVRRSPVDDDEIVRRFSARSKNDVRTALQWLKDSHLVRHTSYTIGRGNIADQMARSGAHFSLLMGHSFG